MGLEEEKSYVCPFDICGCVCRKLDIMGVIPEAENGPYKPVVSVIRSVFVAWKIEGEISIVASSLQKGTLTRI